MIVNSLYFIPRTRPYSIRAVQNIRLVTDLKQWVYLFLSDLCPLMSNMWMLVSSEHRPWLEQKSTYDTWPILNWVSVMPTVFWRASEHICLCWHIALQPNYTVAWLPSARHERGSPLTVIEFKNSAGIAFWRLSGLSIIKESALCMIFSSPGNVFICLSWYCQHHHSCKTERCIQKTTDQAFAQDLRCQCLGKIINSVTTMHANRKHNRSIWLCTCPEPTSKRYCAKAAFSGLLMSWQFLVRKWIWVFLHKNDLQ